MNKYRLNQILEILTAPYKDADLIKKDFLAEREEAFCAFLESTKLFNTKSRNEYSERYEKAHREFGIYLLRCCTGMTKSLDDVLLIGEKFFPRSGILKKMEEIYPGAERRDMVMSYYVDNIFRIADSLLTSRDGVIAIRTWKNKPGENRKEDILGSYEAFDKVEIWNSLSRIVTPDLFVAAFVILNGNNMHMFYGQGASISLADKLLMRNLEKGMAETHLHINVASDYMILWEKNMNLAIWKENRSDYKDNVFDALLFNLAVYRCVTAFYLEGYVRKSYKEFLGQEFPEIVDNILQKSDTAGWKSREEKYIWISDIENKLEYLFGRSLDITIMGEKDILFSVLYEEYEGLNTCAEYIFLAKSLAYIKENEDVEFTRYFLQYIRIKNTYFSKIFENNTVQGLIWFQRYFAQSSGAFKRWIKDERRWNYILYTQVNIEALKKLEFRISVDTQKKFYVPDDKLAQLELQKELLKFIRKFLVNYRSFIHGRAKAPTIGMVLHFNKRKSLDNISGFFCWRMIDEDQLYDSEHKIALRRKCVYIARAIAAIRNEISYLDEYLVGLDVASDENAAEPWLFSPAYNEVRNRKLTELVKKIGEDDEKIACKRINNIGLTYHVGEDYRHILSGLRHIDEVVEKYNYRSCDRIGHGIALGVDVDYWAANNRNVMIPLGEYLDNLLWVWGLLVENSYELPTSAYALEGKILHIASRIYNHMTGITVHILYQAYQEKFKQTFIKRFRQYHKEITKREKEVSKQRMGKCLYGDCNDYDVELWDAFKIICTYFCPIYEERYHQVIWLETSDEDVKLLKALQNYMMDKIQKKGIYIETNPTSNLAIGEIESLYSHYAVRLNTMADTRPKHNIMVTVNSDDPMVFNTNVENELAYMYHGLNSAGYDSQTVLEWIDKVRQYGLESSFIKKIKSVEEMTREITIIEKEIEDFLKR